VSVIQNVRVPGGGTLVFVHVRLVVWQRREGETSVAGRQQASAAEAPERPPAPSKITAYAVNGQSHAPKVLAV